MRAVLRNLRWGRGSQMFAKGLRANADLGRRKEVHDSLTSSLSVSVATHPKKTPMTNASIVMSNLLVEH
jgi:hypothetical protein